MQIFKYKNTGGKDHDESNFTRTEATVSNGEAVITRKMFFRADSDTEDSVDIMSLPFFPQKNSAHPKHPAYKYHGNARISPISSNSRIWCAELEYSTSEPNATDSGGFPVTSETKPWKLKPDNIQFAYPETILPFTASYNETGVLYDNNGDAVKPVANSAGDKIIAEHSVRNMQMSFTFATENWDINNSITYGNTINSKDISICGLKIPAGCALLLPPECSYVTVYKENSTSVKWKYWSVSVNILIDIAGTILRRKMLDIGDRAKFNSIDLSDDDMLKDAKTLIPGFSHFIIPEDKKPSQICHFRLLKAQNITSKRKNYTPTGELVFCGWNQYLAIRELYLRASKMLMHAAPPVCESLYELQVEQDSQMPLNNGYLFTKAIDGHSDYKNNTPYKTLTFREYPKRSWSGLNFPVKGIQW